MKRFVPIHRKTLETNPSQFEQAAMCKANKDSERSPIVSHVVDRQLTDDTVNTLSEETHRVQDKGLPQRPSGLGVAAEF